MMHVNDVRKALSLSSEEFKELPLHVAAFNGLLVDSYKDYFDQIFLSTLNEQKNHYGYSACLGFLLFDNPDDDWLRKEFEDEANQLAGRTFFSPNRAPRFEVDSIALLGVSVGLLMVESAGSDIAWFIELLDQSIDTLKHDQWEVGFAQSAKELLTNRDWSIIEDAMIRLAVPSALNQPFEPDNSQEAWSRAINFNDSDVLTCRSIKLAVIDQCADLLRNLPINDVSISELIKLLENISESMSHWTYEIKTRVKGSELRKWHIDHEYHVQNLLWTILKPIFRDLVDEESLPKIGHMSPRYDLGIPSLQTIIEVKFMRKTGQAECKKITEEVAADSAIYISPKTSYKRIIVFIWDNCRQTEEYQLLKQGMGSLTGIEGVIILPRPKRMHEGE